MDFETLLKSAGPAAGTVTLMALAIKWLLNDRAAILKLLDESRQENKELRELRVTELRESAELLAQSSEVVRDALASFDKSLDALVQTIQELKAQETTESAALALALQRYESALRDLQTAVGNARWGS